MTALVRFEEEQAVLCAAMGEVTAWHAAIGALTVRDFTDERHQAIFAAVVSVTPTGQHTDLLPVLRALDRRPELREYVGTLLDVVPTFDPLPNWIAALTDASLRRRTAAALTDATAKLSQGESRDVVEHALDQRLSAIRASAPDARVFDDKRAMASAALTYLTDDNAARAGTPYGFAKWDSAVLPAMRGHLVLLGGAPGSGKSTVARNLFRQWTHRYERRVGVLTCEMTGEEQLVHLACIDAEVSVEDYYRRRLTATQAQAFRECLEYWRDTDRLLVNEMGAVTPETALRIFRRWREQGVDHFVVDHLHRFNYGATRSGDDLRLPVSAAARDLKNFAKDSEAVVCALVQYSKIKPHEEPGDEKIKESNTVLEEADAVFHIYRPNVACERDISGLPRPLVKGDGGRYFDGDMPHGSFAAPDHEAVYIKLGKQRRKLRDGLIRVPFNHRLGVLYDVRREDTSSRPPLRVA